MQSFRAGDLPSCHNDGFEEFSLADVLGHCGNVTLSHHIRRSDENGLQVGLHGGFEFSSSKYDD